MGKTKTRIKMYSAGNYQKEEEWLNRESVKGWHLVKTNGLVHHFEYDPENQFTYQLDFIENKGEESEKKEFYAEMGWEWIHTMFNGWVYVRKEGKTEALYSDDESKFNFFKKILSRTVFLVFFLIIYLPIYNNLSSRIDFTILLTVIQGVLTFAALFMAKFVRDAYRALAHMSKSIDLTETDTQFVNLWSILSWAVPVVVLIYPVMFIEGIISRFIGG